MELTRCERCGDAACACKPESFTQVTTPKDEAYVKAREIEAKDSASICYCAGPTCSGCEHNIRRIFRLGSDFGYEYTKRESEAKIEELQSSLELTQQAELYLRKVNQRLKSNVAQLEQCLEIAKEGLESSMCWCERSVNPECKKHTALARVEAIRKGEK